MSKAISLPFSFDSNGSISTSQDPKKIIQDRVVLVCMTLMGERVMRPAFGTHVRRTAFENYSAAIDLIKQEIQTSFSTWLPYLSATNVNAAVDPTDGKLNITVNYTYGSSQTIESVTVKTAVLSTSGSLISEVPNG